MRPGPKTLKTYVTPDGREVFTEWCLGLRDRQTLVRIQARVDRLEVGNPGDHRWLGGGVFEMRLDFGPGYRIYCGEESDTIVILLCGGDKSTQSNDILIAQEFWADYKRRS